TLSPLVPLAHDGQEPLVIVLSAIQGQILLKVESRAPQLTASFEDLGDFREITNGLMGLELEGLLEREFAGYRVTPRGALVAAVLRART
ncbi:MAG TPA: hypothetical protein VGW79_07410, partial [Actinomycetota bacterium]|nr:hypothetical protein [Actinomycetota bacterium]